MKYRANWLARTLQFPFGTALGLVLGVGTLNPRNVGEWLAREQVPSYLFGAAMLPAGMCSLYGDPLWLGGSYRMIPPDGVRHSRVSKGISIGSLFAGAALITVSVCRNYGVF